MASDPRLYKWESDKGVEEDLQRQRHLFLQLAENALVVAESLRGNYFENTANFVGALRLKMARAARGLDPPILGVQQIDTLNWSDVRAEIVTFIDGGVGQVQISSQVPILLRVGSYTVRTGERRITKRESFGYYPVILGDLEGGSKDRKDFVDIVRITAELLGGLSALRRTPELDVLMFHGPLVYHVGLYQEHAPFTEKDIDLFLAQYGHSDALGRDIKARFLAEARLDVYPAMTSRSDELIRRRLFDPIAWIAFLYRELIDTARSSPRAPIIAGVVERGNERSFVEDVLLPRVFRGLRERNNGDYFNTMFGRTDLTTPKSLLDRLGYTDSLLLAMLLRPGEATESWELDKYGALRHGGTILPGEAFETPMDWRVLSPRSRFGFPEVCACYVHVSDTTLPLRVEVFPSLGDDQMQRAAEHVYLYARLLPGYGFPIGLDIVDKYAKVPNWLTDAYGKLIRHQLGVSLQQGDVSDAEMRRILVQAIYMTHRDWIFRPDV